MVAYQHLGLVPMGCRAGDRLSLTSNECTAHPAYPSKVRIPREGARAPWAGESESHVAAEDAG